MSTSTSTSNRKSGGAWKETRHDKWYHLAKEQGFRSRAAFKLIQLNKKYEFLQSTKSCLDLGAAPGGWLQVCSKFMPVSSLLIGVDLVPIARMRGVTTIQADITTPECKTLIKKELQGWDVDLVLHDGAPNVVGGQLFSRDSYQQNELVIYALRLATHFLRPQGTFVSKVFRSQDYNALLWTLQQFFHSVDVSKPMASRNASAEIFVVCRGYKAPKSIDPFLLDPSHIFQQFEDDIKLVNKALDPFQATKKKPSRSRQGYADAETQSGLLAKSCSIVDFVTADEPILMLGAYHSFSFDTKRPPSSASPPSSSAAKALADDDGHREIVSMILSHAATTPDIRSLCADLKVLGKGDFKALLKWRKKISLFLRECEKEKIDVENGDAEEEAVTEEVPLTEEEAAAREEAAMDEALGELNEKRARQQKLALRKKHVAKMKQNQRLLLNANNLTDVNEMIGGNEKEGQDGSLFKLSTISTQKVLDLLEAQASDVYAHHEEEEEPDEDEDDNDAAAGARLRDTSAANQKTLKSEPQTHQQRRDQLLHSMKDAQEEEEEYYASLERELDDMYDRYKQKRQIVDKHDLEQKARAAEKLLSSGKSSRNAARSSSPEEEVEDQEMRAKEEQEEVEELEDQDDEGDESMIPYAAAAHAGVKRKLSSQEESESARARKIAAIAATAHSSAPNPLVVDVKEEVTRSSRALKAQRFFERDIFAGLEEDEQPQIASSKHRQQHFKAEAPLGGSSSTSRAHPRLTLAEMLNEGGMMDSDDDDEDERASGNDESDEEVRRSRWLSVADSADEPVLTRAERARRLKAEQDAAKLKRAPLIGLDSLGKSRAQIEQESIAKARREKQAAKQARRLARATAAALGLDAERAKVEEDQEEENGMEDASLNMVHFDDAQANLDLSSSEETDGEPSPRVKSPSFSSDVDMLVDQDSKKKAKRLARRARRDAGEEAVVASSSSRKPLKRRSAVEDEIEAANAVHFEEVAVEDEFSQDEDAVATTLALGTKALVKKQRQDLMDSSYNRYAVDLDEQSGLPQWFLHEERLHSTANIPVTQDEMNALKQRLRAINSKPIKKIAEAAARNKQRTERRWLKIKGQMDDVANSIGEDAGGNMVSKIKQMERWQPRKTRGNSAVTRSTLLRAKAAAVSRPRAKAHKRVKGPRLQSTSV